MRLALILILALSVEQWLDQHFESTPPPKPKNIDVKFR